MLMLENASSMRSQTKIKRWNSRYWSKVVVKAANDLIKLLKNRKKKMDLQKQKKTGKLFLLKTSNLDI